MNEELAKEYLSKIINNIQEVYKLDEAIKIYEQKMNKELAEEKDAIKSIIFGCNTKEEIVDALRSRTMKSDIRNSVFIGMNAKQLSMLKELEAIMDDILDRVIVTGIDIPPEWEEMANSIHAQVNSFENKIKIMTEQLQKNSLEFNEFLTNSLNV